MAESELFQRTGNFIHALERLSVGDRAALRREAGGTLLQAGGEALGAFYRALPQGIDPFLEGRFFHIACLSCMWKPDQLKGARPYEFCLRRIRNEGYESFDNKFNALLDCRWNDEDGYLQIKLNRVTKQMRQKELLPDFRILLLDLIGWNGVERKVQRRWARAYYGEVNSAHEDNIVKEEEKNAV